LFLNKASSGNSRQPVWVSACLADCRLPTAFFPRSLSSTCACLVCVEGPLADSTSAISFALNINTYLCPIIKSSAPRALHKKNQMIKRILLAAGFIMAVHMCIYAQISKVEIEKMFNETGLTMDSIKRVYLSNFIVFDEEGNSKRLEMYFDRSPADGQNIFAFVETGFKINYITGGRNKVAHFYPYASMVAFDIFPGYMRFTLKD
jgi:hypothetical protein